MIGDSTFGDFAETDQMPLQYNLPSGEPLSAQIIRLMKQLDLTVNKLGNVQVDLARLAVKYEHTMAAMETHAKLMQEDKALVASKFVQLESRVSKLESFVWKFLGGATAALLLIEWFFRFYRGK